MNEQDDELDIPEVEPEHDVVEPWANDGPPPLSEWREGILSPAYKSQTTPLTPDEEDDTSAVLVRYLAHHDPHASHEAKTFPSFIALYLHRRNDYFFQTRLTQTMTEAGCASYALDPRKYGRSLRPWQQIGYVDDLSVYNEEIGETLSIMHAEQGYLPLILVEHSTGRLVATLWVHRHSGAVTGLVLSSPWLEMHTVVNLRPVAQPTFGWIASRNSKWGVPSGGGLDFYDRSLLYGRQASGLPTPEGISEDDPVVTGWGYIRAWKHSESYPIPATWLDVIIAGRETIEKDARLACLVLLATSTTSYFESEWCEKVFTSDAILGVEIIREHSSRLADQVAITHFPDKHNLFLSDPDVHEEVYDMMRR